MNDTTIILIVFVELSLVLGLTFLRLWYQMVMSSKISGELKAFKMDARRIHNNITKKGDIKDDLGGMDIKELAKLFGIDSKIMDNPIVKGFLQGIMKPKDKQNEIEMFNR